MDVLIIGGPHDGERHEIRGDLRCDPLTIRLPARTGRPAFETHTYRVITIYGYYLGVHEDLGAGEGLAALVRGYPQPIRD